MPYYADLKRQSISTLSSAAFLRKFFEGCVLSGLSLMCALSAEDSSQLPYKKEKINAIPHAWLSGGLILLKAQENGLQFANSPQQVSSDSMYRIGPTLSPHFTWDTGVKIDAGYQPKDRTFYGSWILIENTAHGAKNAESGTGFFPKMSLQRNLTSHDYVTSGFIDWKCNTNMVDLGTFFSWKLLPYLAIKNRVGVKVLSLDQKFDVKYGGGIFNGGIDHVIMKNDFFGGGLSIGFSPNITFPQGFTLLGEIGASGLLGGFFLKQTEDYLDRSLFYAVHNTTRFRWIIDAKAAINWQKDLLYKALVLSVQAGVEWHEFFKQNELPYAFLSMGSRNLIFRGGFISICLGF